MSLKQETFSAGRWSTASTASVSMIQFFQLAILARLLEPSDFGLMAVSAAVLAVMTLLADLGLHHAVIHYNEMPVRHLSSLFWLNISISIALMLLMMGFAPVIGAAYGSDTLTSLLQWLGPTFPLLAVGQQMRALAAKDLRFERLALVEVAAAIFGCACAVAAALSGSGVYSLAIGVLVTAGAGSALAWVLLPKSYRPARHFVISEVRPYMRFGSYLVGERVANALRRDADVFACGLALAPASVGLYSVPRDLCLRIGMAVNSIIVRVGFPVMARVKTDPDRLRHIYLRALGMTASINFPAYVLIGLYAEDLVRLLFGDQWVEAAIYLKILAVWGLVRSTGNPVGSLLYATGRTKRAFWWNVLLLLTLPILYWLAVDGFGLLGLATAIAGIQLALVVPAWRFLVRPCCDATLVEYSSQLLIPLLMALGAGAAAFSATLALSGDLSRLAIGGLTFSAAYLGLSWLFNREWAMAMLALVDLRKAIKG